MRILLLPVKLILLPIIVVVGVGRAFLIFVVAIASTLLSYVSYALGILGILTYLFGSVNSLMNGTGLLIVAFLISPIGIPWVADWLLLKIGDLHETIIDFFRYS